MGGPHLQTVPETHLDALIRASRAVDDPGLRVATMLADDPILQTWAAPEALRALGAPRAPGERAGRLAVVTLGRSADALARGILAVFGDAVDEGVVAVPAGATPDAARSGPGLPAQITRFEARPSDAGRALVGLLGDLGPRDRIVVAVSPGTDAAAVAPVPGLARGDIDDVVGRAGAAGWPAPRTAALRSRLDRLRGGGLVALAAPASLLGIRLPGEPAASDPLGAAPPSGRSLEIELRVAGVAIPDPVVTALRRPDAAHPTWGVDAQTARDVRTLDHRPAGLGAALGEARARGLAVTVLTDRLQGSPDDAGRGLARVALAMADGVGGLDLPACALAAGSTSGAADRHGRLARAAAALLGGRPGVAVRSWTPAAGGPDLYAVVVLGAG